MTMMASVILDGEHTRAEGGGGGEDTDDATLVERIIAGEPGLYPVLVRRHARRLFRVVRAIARTDSDAQRTIERALARAFDRLEMRRRQATFETWLTRFAVREALRFRDGLGCARELDRRLEGEGAADAELEHGTDDPARARLEAAVDRLPDSLRVAFVWARVEGIDASEVAVMLGATRQAVASRLHRAHAALAKALGGAPETELGSLFQLDDESLGEVVLGVSRRLA
jgi:RNA polymerase sigma-70 factor (ECF subfamily)